MNTAILHRRGIRMDLLRMYKSLDKITKKFTDKGHNKEDARSLAWKEFHSKLYKFN